MPEHLVPIFRGRAISVVCLWAAERLGAEPRKASDPVSHQTPDIGTILQS